MLNQLATAAFTAFVLASALPAQERLGIGHPVRIHTAGAVFNGDLDFSRADSVAVMVGPRCGLSLIPNIFNCLTASSYRRTRVSSLIASVTRVDVGEPNRIAGVVLGLIGGAGLDFMLLFDGANLKTPGAVTIMAGGGLIGSAFGPRNKWREVNLGLLKSR